MCSATVMACVVQMMRELRAAGPLSIDSLKHCLQDQVIGVDAANVDEMFSSAWKIMNRRSCLMVEEYEMFGDRPPIADRTYVVAERMYDQQGNYKGIE